MASFLFKVITEIYTVSIILKCVKDLNHFRNVFTVIQWLYPF